MYLINGTEVSKNNFNSPIENLSFWRGDGIFEAIRIHDGFLFALDRHLKRLERSAQKMLFNNIDFDSIKKDLQKVASNFTQGYVRVIISRSETFENENISFQHLGNLKFTYPTYFYPKYDEELNELNDLFFENFGKLPNKIVIRAYEITLDLILRSAYRRKLVKSINIGETKYYQNRFNYKNKEQGYINESILLIMHDNLEVLEISSVK